jgi:hypothetical protein
MHNAITRPSYSSCTQLLLKSRPRKLARIHLTPESAPKLCFRGVRNHEVEGGVVERGAEGVVMIFSECTEDGERVRRRRLRGAGEDGTCTADSAS